MPRAAQVKLKLADGFKDSRPAAAAKRGLPGPLGFAGQD